MLREGEAQELCSVKSLLQDWDDDILKSVTTAVSFQYSKQIYNF